jgi:hypothetical protein
MLSAGNKGVLSTLDLLYSTQDAISADHVQVGANMICELSYSFFPGKWTYKQLAEAFRGTYIACTSYPTMKNTRYRIYFQDEELCLQEYIYELQEEVESGIPVPS